MLNDFRSFWRIARGAAVSLLAAIVIAAAANPTYAAEIAKDRGAAQAEAALERYVSGNGDPSWPVESVEIHATLPKLAKAGELQAIRSTTGPEGPEYRVLQLTGDRTVKDQVIARYLNAQERTSRTPRSSVALTPANYRFAYKGIVDDGERLAYVFRITPRKKRAGLMKGELWIDIGTGLPIRRSGYLVKSPSLWIKRVALTQEDSLRDGTVQSRLTHIRVDTRLVGPADLVISERPLGIGEGHPATGLDDNGGQQ
jgi:hypothetical protein